MQINIASPQVHGLAAAWPLDDGGGVIARASYGGYHGTITNPLRTALQTGSCLAFDGTNRYVNCGDLPYVDGLGQLTVSLLFRPSGTGSQTTNKVLVSKWDSTNGYQFVLGYGNDTASKITFSVRTGGTGTGGSNNSSGFTPNALSPGIIYHCVGVYDGTTVKLYINGVLTSSGAGSGTINTNVNSNLVFGKYTTSTSQYLYGALADVRIYNKSLSTLEVQDIYSNSSELYITPDSFDNICTLETQINETKAYTTFQALVKHLGRQKEYVSLLSITKQLIYVKEYATQEAVIKLLTNEKWYTTYQRIKKELSTAKGYATALQAIKLLALEKQYATYLSVTGSTITLESLYAQLTEIQQTLVAIQNTQLTLADIEALDYLTRKKFIAYFLALKDL